VVNLQKNVGLLRGRSMDDIFFGLEWAKENRLPINKSATCRYPQYAREEMKKI